MSKWMKTVGILVATLLVIAIISYMNRASIIDFFAAESPVEIQSVEEHEAQPSVATEVPEPMEELQANHNCTIEGELLDGNQQWFQAKTRLVSIVANEQTYDEALGESHRYFVVQNTENCQEVFSETLPVNLSPDYPYYLTSIDSLEGELVGIIGTNQFFVYDVMNNTLSQPLRPNFKGERYQEDAQSGMIVALETWGKYIVGYAEDEGVFAYNMTIPRSPKQVEPMAEYEKANENYTSLFLLKAAEDDQQALVPNYNANDRKFDLNPMLEAAQPIAQQMTKSAKNEQYVILRLDNKSKTAVAIDMQTGNRIALPDELTSKSDAEIRAWLSKQ